MSVSKKKFDLVKYGLTGAHKKLGVNLFRFVFSGTKKSDLSEKRFFVELELLNPHVSPNVPVFGYAPKTNVNPEDLQEILLGKTSQKTYSGEDIETPSYCAIRFGVLGTESKLLCAYFPFNKLYFFQHPFKIEVGKFSFLEDSLVGNIFLTESEVQNHPEYFCNSGEVSWNLKYQVERFASKGFKNKTERWLPFGLVSSFYGTVNLDGEEYSVLPQKSRGYVERFWSKNFNLDTWFHLSSCDLVSLISGKHLNNYSFSIQGVFNNKLSVICNFGDTDISFSADQTDRDYTVIWDCSQVPESEDSDFQNLHWSVSVTSKEWVLDIDIFCNLKALTNRNLELPEGKRTVLNIVQCGSGVGEIKLYKKLKNSLEQIEYAKTESSFCEFGKKESHDY